MKVAAFAKYLHRMSSSTKCKSRPNVDRQWKWNRHGRKPTVWRAARFCAVAMPLCVLWTEDKQLRDT